LHQTDKIEQLMLKHNCRKNPVMNMWPRMLRINTRCTQCTQESGQGHVFDMGVTCQVQL
jgi:hypothetical protein